MFLGTAPGSKTYMDRLTSAEAMVMQFPTWCFGMPAMLKGFCDRLLMPGVAFDLSDPAHVKPSLVNLQQNRRRRDLWPAVVYGEMDGETRLARR